MPSGLGRGSKPAVSVEDLGTKVPSKEFPGCEKPDSCLAVDVAALVTAGKSAAR